MHIGNVVKYLNCE